MQFLRPPRASMSAVRADRPCDCYWLRRDVFDGFLAERPSLQLGLLRNLLRTATRIQARLTQEVVALGDGA